MANSTNDGAFIESGVSSQKRRRVLAPGTDVAMWESRFAAIEAQLKQYRTENETLHKRVESLESTFEATVKSVEKNKRNVALSYDLRFKLKILTEAGRGWDHSLSYSNATNKVVTDQLLSYVSGLTEHSSFTKSMVQTKIKALFKNTRSASNRSAEENAELSVANSCHSLRIKKLGDRRMAHRDNLAVLEQEFGSDSKQLLEPDLMSDEEGVFEDDDEGNKIKVGFNVLSPSWRSEKANTFYARLDKLVIKRHGKDRRSLPRVPGAVEKSVPESYDGKLPAWAIKEYL